MSHFRKFYITILISLVISGCNIDIPIENHLSDPHVLTSTKQAGELLTNAYLSVPTNELELSILAGDFKPTIYAGRTPDLVQLYLWQPRQIESLSTSYWKQCYSTIEATQTLLQRLPNFTPNQKEEQIELDRIHAEALLLQANAYLELLQLFATPYKDAREAGVIIKKKEYEEDQPRSTKSEVLNHISDLLRQANALLYDKTPSSNNRFLGHDALVLLRVWYHLYKSEYSEIIPIVEDALKECPITELSYYKSQLTDYYEGKSPRVIWSLQGSFENYYSQIYSSEIGDRRWQHGFIPQPEMVSYYQKEPYTMMHNGKRLLGKYLQAQMNMTSIIAIPKMRRVELLFIYIEALLQLSRIDDAKAALKQYYGESFQKLTLERLIQLKQQEFLGEGVNFLDAKRLNQPIHIYNSDGKVTQTIQRGDYRLTWPIPAKELLSNSHPIEQNEGWPTYEKNNNN